MKIKTSFQHAAWESPTLLIRFPQERYAHCFNEDGRTELNSFLKPPPGLRGRNPPRGYLTVTHNGTSRHSTCPLLT